MAVTQTFTGDASSLQRELEKTQQQYARLEQQISRLQQESETGSERTINTNDRVVASLTRVAAGYASIQSAIQTVNEALQQQRDLERQALDEQLTVAQSEARLRVALGPSATREEFLAVREEALQMANIVGVPVQQVNTALTGALSAAQTNVPLAQAAVSAALLAGRHQGTAAVEALAGGAIDLSRIVGGGITPEQAVSFIIQGFGQARTGELEQATRPFAEAIGAMLPTVPRQEPQEAARQAAAIVATMSGLRGDPMMRETGTVATALMTRAETFFRGDIPGMTPAEEAEMRARLGADPGTLLGRLQSISAAPAEVLQQFRDMFGQATFGSFLSGFVQQNVGDVAAAARGIRFDEQEFQMLSRSLEADSPLLQLATERGRDVAEYQQSVLLRTGLSREARAREIGQETFEQLDPTIAERFGRIIGLKLSQLPIIGAFNDPIEQERMLLEGLMDPRYTFTTPEQQQQRNVIIERALEKLDRLTETAGQTAAQAQPNRHHEN